VLALIGLLLERLVIRRFYTAPIIAMLGTYAIGRRGPSALGLVDAG
jgi:branched-chain amino acid transport system permease protein